MEECKQHILFIYSSYAHYMPSCWIAVAQPAADGSVATDASMCGAVVNDTAGVRPVYAPYNIG
jgi:hypothetical protein